MCSQNHKPCGDSRLGCPAERSEAAISPSLENPPLTFVVVASRINSVKG